MRARNCVSVAVRREAPQKCKPKTHLKCARECRKLRNGKANAFEMRFQNERHARGSGASRGGPRGVVFAMVWLGGRFSERGDLLPP